MSLPKKKKKMIFVDGRGTTFSLVFTSLIVFE